MLVVTKMRNRTEQLRNIPFRSATKLWNVTVQLRCEIASEIERNNERKSWCCASDENYLAKQSYPASKGSNP